MELEKQTLIRTMRLILTCLILFLVTWYYQVPERIWSLITVWFVMTEYSNVGGVLKKSFYRFIGTLISGLYALVIIYCFANNVLINILALALGVFVYMYYFLDTDKMYIGIIGSVTLTISLLNHNNIDAAILRTFNIIIGILGSMFMIRFFYPTYAKDQLIESQIMLIKNIMQIMQPFIDPLKNLNRVKKEYMQSEQDYLKNLVTFKTLLNEANIETYNTPLFITYNSQAVEHTRHIFRMLSVFINYLSSEESRSDPAIIKEFQRFLSTLQLIIERLQLNNQSLVKPFVEETKSVSDTLLTNISREIDALDDAINQLGFIYYTPHLGQYSYAN